MDDIENPPDPHDLATAPTKPAWRSWVAAGAVGALIVGGGAFLLGRGDDGQPTATAAANSDTSTDAGTGAPGAPGGLGGPGGPGTGGEITAIDGTTITLDAEGETYTVSTSDDTQVSETVEGSADDIAVGDTVVVIGEVVDGAVTAESISEGGLGRGFGGPGGGPGGGGTPPDGFELPDGVEPPEGLDPPGGFDPSQGGGPPAGGLGGFTNGEVTTVEGSTLTVSTDDGDTVTVTATEDTMVTITLDGEVDDLDIGDTIQVIGEVDGSSVDAAIIRLGELGGFGPGGFGGPPPGADGSEEAS